MSQMINLKEATTEQLKATAYDNVCQIENSKHIISVINQELSERQNVVEMPKDLDTNDKKDKDVKK